MERTQTVYFDGDSMERTFKSHAIEFLESQSQSWQQAAFLCKQAAGIAVYQHKSGPLSFLLDVVLKGSKYATACRKLLQALFVGVEQDGEKYILADSLRLQKDKGTGLYNVPQCADVATFKQALQVLAMSHKTCGAQFSAIEKAIVSKPRAAKAWTFETMRADMLKRYTHFASNADKVAIEKAIATLFNK